MDKIKAVYGFSRRLAPFSQLAPSEAVDLLASWGANAFFGGYDDQAVAQEAHDKGMLVLAELGCFVGEAWWTRCPESRPITSEGEPLPKLEWYAGVNPCIPAVREALLDDLRALVQEHDLDGVWLDFIRWPSRWESPDPPVYQTSFDPSALALFQEECGLQLDHFQDARQAADWILSHHQEAWTAWKCGQITSWVQAAAKVVHEAARRPCLLGLFGVPWRREDRDGAITRIMGQDFAAVAPYVDVFSPMVYHRMCGQPAKWIASVTDEVHALSGKPVWPVIQAQSEPDRLSDNDLGQAMAAAMGTPSASGLILFNLKGVVDEGHQDVVKANWTRP